MTLSQPTAATTKYYVGTNLNMGSAVRSGVNEFVNGHWRLRANK